MPKRIESESNSQEHPQVIDATPEGGYQVRENKDKVLEFIKKSELQNSDKIKELKTKIEQPETSDRKSIEKKIRDELIEKAWNKLSNEDRRKYEDGPEEYEAEMEEKRSELNEALEKDEVSLSKEVFWKLIIKGFTPEEIYKIYNASLIDKIADLAPSKETLLAAGYSTATGILLTGTAAFVQGGYTIGEYLGTFGLVATVTFVASTWLLNLGKSKEKPDHNMNPGASDDWVAEERLNESYRESRTKEGFKELAENLAGDVKKEVEEAIEGQV